MRNFNVDLSNCANEPIHIPGSVQSWGFLVVANASTKVISYVSANILQYLNITAGSILGQKLSMLESLISNETTANPLTTFANSIQKTDSEQAVFEVSWNGQEFDLLIHQNGKLLYLEFESRKEAPSTDLHSQIGRAVSSILTPSELPEVLDNAVAVVKELVNYDRVMIYKFLEDDHGKVVAESKEDTLDPFLDLHYPASDIPAQARALYTLNKSRIIADVHSEVSPILALTEAPLDLTYSVLRSVSPVHIQYLKNMGVASSFSISIICKGRLWGLISCHHYTPKFLGHRVREAAKLLGQVVSSAIEFKEEELLNNAQKNHKNLLDSIIRQLRTEKDLRDVLVNPEMSFRNVVNATGAVLTFEGTMVKDGLTPTDAQISEIVQWLSENKVDHIFQTNNLPGAMPAAADFADVSSGILACAISREMKEYVIWFRPEYVQNIKWAGNPDKPVEVGEDGLLTISPRKSFDSFRQILKHTSETWHQYEQNLAARLKDEILYTINKRASEIRVLNEKLKNAYDQLETFTSTISHDLRTPLAVIKNYAQLLERNKSLNDTGKQFAARISVGVEKMDRLITEVLEYSRLERSDIRFDPIDMGALLEGIRQEILVAFNTPDQIFELGDCPPIAGDKTMIYQVFLNLANNAVKYSRLSQPSIVRIDGQENELEVIYRVEDNGIGISKQHYGKIFELFRRVNVSEEFEGTGVGLAIVKRIVEKHQARIWIESEPGKGTTFFVAFRKCY